MKRYSKWHKIKTEIENSLNKRVFFYEREVWWCSLGSNIGYEQDGRGKKFARPVLIFKKFNNEVFWAIPLSTKIKFGRFYSAIRVQDNINRVAIISQLRLIDAKRLIDRIGNIEKENYLDIQKAVMNLLNS